MVTYIYISIITGLILYIVWLILYIVWLRHQVRETEGYKQRVLNRYHELIDGLVKVQDKVDLDKDTMVDYYYRIDEVI